MVSSWILGLSLFCAAPGQGLTPQDAEVKAVVEECRPCLSKKGKDWDDRNWSNVYEWDVCLEDRLLRKVTPAQKMAIKRYLSELGYYAFNAKKQTFSNARKRIQPKDIDGILAVIETTLRSQGDPARLPVLEAPPEAQLAEGAKAPKGLPEAAILAPPPLVAPAPVRSASGEAPAEEKPKTHLPEAPVSAPPVSRPGGQAASGEDLLPKVLPEDRVVIGHGAILLPKGVFLLVRKGSRYGAIRITGLRPGGQGEAGTAIYESYFQGDGSGSFAASNLERRGGRVAMKPLEDSGQRRSRGSSILLVGKWSFEYIVPGGIRVFPYSEAGADQGYEFAPVAMGEITGVDVHDKRIKWYRHEPHTKVELLVKDLVQ